MLPNTNDWQAQIAAVTSRFNQEYQGNKPDLPGEVRTMPIYHEYASGLLQGKLVSPFWEIALPQKNQHCLDLGCGMSFLFYPWREWGAFFHGHDTSPFARDTLNTRGPQLNSKLFKGVTLAAAHELEYEPETFDLAIATGLSCYYPIQYWADVLSAVKRVLKPGGHFVFDVVNRTAPLAENWAILETFLGTEVFLESENAWKQVIQSAGGKVVKTLPGEILDVIKVKF